MDALLGILPLPDTSSVSLPYSGSVLNSTRPTSAPVPSEAALRPMHRGSFPLPSINLQNSRASSSSAHTLNRAASFGLSFSKTPAHTVSPVLSIE